MVLASSRALEYAGKVSRRRWLGLASRFLLILHLNFGRRGHRFLTRLMNSLCNYRGYQRLRINWAGTIQPKVLQDCLFNQWLFKPPKR